MKCIINMNSRAKPGDVGPRFAGQISDPQPTPSRGLAEIAGVGGEKSGGSTPGMTARYLPGSLIEVESRPCDAFSGTWLVLGMSRDGRDVRVARPLEPFDPLDALWQPFEAFIPVTRCALAIAPNPVVALLICWFDFATWFESPEVTFP